MTRPLRIAVASGKGGTGKTTIATNLAVALAEAGRRVAYVDCDVEEPNGHIFLKPTISERHDVATLVPAVDETRCTHCGACGQACRYSAITVLPGKVLTFPKLCHGCGGCALACPESVIREVGRTVGTVETGTSGSAAFLQGRLNIGEAMAPPVIRAVLDHAPGDRLLVMDAPPGTSCPAIEATRSADVVLLVTEPTPFGLNDLKLSVEMLQALSLPFAVVVNRARTNDRRMVEYCEREHFPVLLEVPDDLAIARAYSRGELAATARPGLMSQLVELEAKLGRLKRTQTRKRARPRSEAEAVDLEPSGLPSQALQLGRRHDVQELVVVSGKGGTGKTTLVASFFALAREAVAADCDVDAANLHLVLAPTVLHRWSFAGSRLAIIRVDLCSDCGLCAERCRFGAVQNPGDDAPAPYTVDPISCEGCGVCADSCPENAANLIPSITGEWFISSTSHGPLVHARLGVAQENSGKLVSLVRSEARALALATQRELLLCDGSPGVGCPVIASIAGARMVVVVAEPTLSGLHDLQRVAELCGQFGVETGVCVNKADLNPEVCTEIEEEATRRGMLRLGRIRYDPSVTAAQANLTTVVEHEDSPAAHDIRAVWERVRRAVVHHQTDVPEPASQAPA